MKNGPVIIEKFNAPLPKQIEYGEKLYSALKNRDDKAVSQGIHANSLLPILREELDNINKMEEHYRQLHTS